MKKQLLISAYLVGLLALPAWGVELKRNDGDVSVVLGLDGDPVKVGKNKAVISVTVKDGSAMRGARVKVHYGIGPRDGKPARNYITTAESVGDKYQAPVEFAAGGEWKITIRVKSKEGKNSTAIIPLNVAN